MNNMIIGLGNTGNQIVQAIARKSTLSDVKLYAIDSNTNGIDIDNASRIKFIPIIADSRAGSGRNRERGNALYKYHEDNHKFDEMYKAASTADEPVIVITSAAGGTGSGSCPALCDALIKKDIRVIPIIICPNINDPDAYHLNTNDLMLELNEIGVETYAIFRNASGDADYTPVNNEVVSLIEIILGKKYDDTILDSIDPSDLDVVLNTPGRIVAISAEASDVESLKKELTRKLLSGFQPCWTQEEANNNTFLTAYSLTSMFADTDFKKVFSEVQDRIVHKYDEYKNICKNDNNGIASATLIVAGLPRAEMKDVDADFKGANTIGSNMKHSKRPDFLKKKKASVINNSEDGKPASSKFLWK